MPRIRLKVRALVVPTEGEKHYADAATEHEVGEEEAARLVGRGAGLAGIAHSSFAFMSVRR